MKKYSVYCHTNKINNKKYIGITSQKPQNRWRNGNGYRNNEHFFRAIQKYGWHNFSHEILYVDLSQEDAEKIEIKLIREWETFNNDKGYNIEFGGNVQKIIPQTTRDRISKALRGHECSEQTKIKISKAKKGKSNPNKGKKMSKEFVEKNRLSHLGQKAWNKNRPYTDEEKAKCNGKSVVCVETKVVYRTAHEASRITGIDFSSICKCRRHKVKTAGGYHWVSAEEWRIPQDE
jgi:group I intron endonuclease